MPTRAMNPHASHGPRRPSAHDQSGVTLVIALIALVIMMAGAVALVRSFGTSSALVGQMAFKRDIMNRGELGMAAARAALISGAVNTETLRETNNLAVNYYASLRANNDNEKGIPKDLVKDSDFKGSASDITGNQVTIRYLIERQCTSTGAFSESTCAVFAKPVATSGGERREQVGPEYGATYRITVRVIGPHNTTVYLQSLVTI
jgi:type IV pilus assembly protein PilX